mmetsp:Transcript_35359/g.100101  ORF Transcript_35359/g.100101 Transcript_35359/m.100101 type:complete len:403 (+) Transcript_35359:1435-2643(+)
MLRAVGLKGALLNEAASHAGALQVEAAAASAGKAANRGSLLSALGALDAPATAHRLGKALEHDALQNLVLVRIHLANLRAPPATLKVHPRVGDSAGSYEQQPAEGQTNFHTVLRVVIHHGLVLLKVAQGAERVERGAGLLQQPEALLCLLVSLRVDNRWLIFLKLLLFASPPVLRTRPAGSLSSTIGSHLMAALLVHVRVVVGVLVHAGARGAVVLHGWRGGKQRIPARLAAPAGAAWDVGAGGLQLPAVGDAVHDNSDREGGAVRGEHPVLHHGLVGERALVIQLLQVEGRGGALGALGAETPHAGLAWKASQRHRLLLHSALLHGLPCQACIVLPPRLAAYSVEVLAVEPLRPPPHPLAAVEQCKTDLRRAGAAAVQVRLHVHIHRGIPWEALGKFALLD